MKTVPDKCPFCESQIIIHGGNPLRSEDGGFATYECKTSQDAKWDNDQFIRVGQSDVCRFREVIILKKQRDEAHERIKRLEEALESIREYWNRDNNQRAMVDACWYAIDKSSEALEAKEDKP